MVQCEMCGKDVGSPNRVKVEGAELDVCDECTDFGTEVRDEESQSSTSTKYSTSSSSDSGSSGGSAGGSSGGTGSSSSSGGGRRRDMFDEMDELAQDYDQRVRQAREDRGLSQEELAKQLNEKASLIGKLEHGDVLPSDDVQAKLESSLGIELSAGSSDGEEDWDGGGEAGGYTLGDVVKRKD